MRVLIVESEKNLGDLWARHLQRAGCQVTLAARQDDALACMRSDPVDVIVMNVALQEGNALEIAEFASYLHPDAGVIFVTGSTFFSDGSIFQLASNARAFIQRDSDPKDLSAMVEYFGKSA